MKTSFFSFLCKQMIIAQQANNKNLLLLISIISLAKRAGFSQLETTTTFWYVLNMRITHCRRCSVCLIICLVFLSSNIFSQMRVSHIDSDSIYSFFEAKGLNPQILPNKSRNTVFPYNIILDFPKKELSSVNA